MTTQRSAVGLQFAVCLEYEATPAPLQYQAQRPSKVQG